MNYLPKIDAVRKEVLEVFTLADCYFISFLDKKRFSLFPHLKKLLKSSAKSEIIEKLLSICIKLRFLDDHKKIFSKYKQRKSYGTFLVEGESQDVFQLREVANKIIHSKAISVKLITEGAIVFDTKGQWNQGNNEDLVEPGEHWEDHILICAKGEFGKKNKKWYVELNLFQFLNDIEMLVEKSEPTNQSDTDKLKGSTVYRV